ncbi:MAG TPA: hypothetical protein ENI32_06920 [Candidatus Syntrophoarchaeum butanivorans]|uniref:Uncharacterized protein n=1 Tax=Candidatus Syntropharchaeum butanivorans TaxID=1839936 RepID=A0A1F2P4I0_9EURY|nr:MAG: hypothetical protein SBU_000751 [Candidatus Syntrophoarchaeum butanivorans]HEC57590.1 hypothetical protein [Candidatus Syntrophoarchaeum butanivorans]
MYQMAFEQVFRFVNTVPFEIKEIVLFVLLLIALFLGFITECRLTHYVKWMENMKERLERVEGEVRREKDRFQEIGGEKKDPLFEAIEPGGTKLESLSRRLGFESSEFFYDVAPSLIDVREAGDLREGLRLIAKKYSIDAVSLASEDGFLIESSGECREDEAAIYSFILQEMKLVGDDHAGSLALGNGISAISMEMDGTNIICIMRADRPINPDREDLKGDLSTVIERFVGVGS